jgi:SAM-dependent methyltransferase
VYDVAFSVRDFEAETAFLLRVARAHAGGAPPQALLELACGPGRHTRAAARAGLRAVGLDRNEAMLAYAREQQAADAASASVSASASASASATASSPAAFVAGDMTALGASAGVGACAPYDIVACLLGSFSHLLTLDDASACLRGAAALLSRRGVLVLQLTHPRALFDGTAAAAARMRDGDDADEEESAWEVPFWDAEAPGLHVCVQWGAPGDTFEPLTQVLHRTVSVTAWAEAADGHNEDAAADVAAAPPLCELREVVPARLFTLPEVQLLAAASGLRVVGLHGDMDVDASPHDEKAHCLVVVLARAADADAAGGGDGAAAARADAAGARAAAAGKQQR